MINRTLRLFRSIITFFISKIKEVENGCVEWRGARCGKYGKLTLLGKQEYAHRVSYLLFVGEISNNDFVLHSCDNPLCVNPNHLRLGTQKENILEAESKGRLYRNTMSGRQHPKYIEISHQLYIQIVDDNDYAFRIAERFEVSLSIVRRIKQGTLVIGEDNERL